VGGVVPLSEHEQRQLEQIEQALYTEDPKFVHAVRSSDPRVHYKRRAVQAVAGFVLGVGLLLGGVISQYIWVGVAGFIVMLVCSMWALTSWRHASGMSGALGMSRPKAAQRRRRREARSRGARGGRGGQVAGPRLMERLEERWRRRQEGG
jgi:Na+/proline symporter